MLRWLLPLLVLATPLAAEERVAEAQRLLNRLGLEAGPVDGAMGPRTRAALDAFLDRRDFALGTGPADPVLILLAGFEGGPMPEAEGLELHVPEGDFPSPGTYQRLEDDTAGFTMTLGAQDYDRTDYRYRSDIFTLGRNLNLDQQRAELVSQGFSAGRTYTLDVSLKVSGPEAGSVLRLIRLGYEGAATLDAFPGSLRFNAGGAVDQVAVLRGDLDDWHRLRLVMHPETYGDGWYRAYVDGELTAEAEGDGTEFEGGFALAFGMMRGATNAEAQVSYRDIAFAEGDLGAPEATEEGEDE